jgi:hypothetical protein
MGGAEGADVVVDGALHVWLLVGCLVAAGMIAGLALVAK